MQYLTDYYNTTLKYELINKFTYSRFNKLPKLKKIILNFNCKTDEIKTISASLLALELLVSQKGVLTTSKKTNLFLKLRKGSPVGCIIVLRKKLVIQFIVKTCMEIFPKTKNFSGLILKKKTNQNQKTDLSYLIKNIFSSSNLEDHYYIFNNLSNLNVTLIASNDKPEELLFILKSLQIPIIQY